jgi:hypothetical protein
VPKDVVWLNIHIAEVYADAEFDPIAAHPTGIPNANNSLEAECEPDRPGRTGKFGKETIPRMLYDPRPVMGNLWLDYMSMNRQAAGVDTGLVYGHALRVANRIRSEDNRQSWARMCGFYAGVTIDQP